MFLSQNLNMIYFGILVFYTIVSYLCLYFLALGIHFFRLGIKACNIYIKEHSEEDK